MRFKRRMRQPINSYPEAYQNPVKICLMDKSSHPEVFTFSYRTPRVAASE